MILKKDGNNLKINVLLWQQFLINQMLAQMTSTGVFDDNTVAATRAVQSAWGLRDDGIVGDMTIAEAVKHGFVGFVVPDSAAAIAEPVAPEKERFDPPGMNVSQAGRDFIAGYEKLRLTVYNDGYGYLTVGIGHRVHPQDKLKLGDTITLERAMKFWEEDLAIHSGPVKHLVHVDLSQNEFDALSSLVFNIGEGSLVLHTGFISSTLLRLLNQGDREGAARHFADFRRSNGQVSQGLITRRGKERAMFLK